MNDDEVCKTVFNAQIDVLDYIGSMIEQLESNNTSKEQIVDAIKHYIEINRLDLERMANPDDMDLGLNYDRKISSIYARYADKYGERQ